GTKHAERSDDTESLMSRPLDDIVSEIDCARISLIKSDVDGFDYDVIDSAEKTITENNCLVYFECQHENSDQFNGYQNCLNRMRKLGYNRFALFDNFGGLVAGSVSIDMVFDLMNYVHKQNNTSSFRTIFYLDILAYKPTHESLVSAVLSEY
ncbi:MAG: hypothetical protein ACI909_002845, partial [Planctomycetota bacterium]